MEIPSSASVRDRFIAAAVSRLRDPLHAVSGLAELMTGTELPVDARRLLDSIRGELAGLTVNLDELLDAARLEAGSITLAARPVATTRQL